MPPVSYTSLEPNIVKELGVNNNSLSFKSDQPISFYASTSFIYTLFFVAIVTAGFYRYVLAAGWRMQGSSTSISKSNETFKTVTLGLLGVFSLFLILYTFNKDLLIGDVGLGALKTDKTTSDTVEKITKNTSPTTPTGSASYNEIVKSHNEILARLLAARITTNHDGKPCTESQINQVGPPPPNCTSLAYLPDDTINMLSRLEGICLCTIQISGGTEPGHSAHGPGKRPVDLSKTNVSSYIEKNFQRETAPGFCYAQYYGLGYHFCDEKNTQPHWHVY